MRNITKHLYNNPLKFGTSSHSMTQTKVISVIFKQNTILVQTKADLGWLCYTWQPITPAFLEEWELPHRPYNASSFPFSIFSPLVTLSPPLLHLSPSVAPLSVRVCLGPAGEALSVNSGARTSPWGPDPWIPTLWEPLFHFTPLSLLECLSSEVRNTCTHCLVHTHTQLAEQMHTHFLTFSSLHTCTHIYTYTALHTQTEWVMQWWKASVLCVNPLTLDSHPESPSPPSVPAKLSL